ncbi:hypothetical protein BP5796_02371 [Coleophoma crateriformis]|uniref:Uncharacterized protein n=1 Tax=Coleophoma crateriformis TaxID=565419 RepID=A0A3D8SY26_9HELO|nr:hypothetical protein BP5796_02371 [Coleophoma crateriformis]
MAGAKVSHLRTTGRSMGSPRLNANILEAQPTRSRKIQSAAVTRSPVNSKAKRTANASVLFKAKVIKPKLGSKRPIKKKALQQAEEPQDAYSLALDRSLDKTRIGIESVVEDALTKTRKGFEARLANPELEIKSLLDVVLVANEEFGTSLAEERLDIVIAYQEERKFETQYTIGQRVADFKEFTETQRSKLRCYWKQWYDIDNAIAVLGRGVLGNFLPEKQEEGQGAGDKTFCRAMELANTEYSTILDEYEEQIDEVRADLVVKLRDTEEACIPPPKVRHLLTQTLQKLRAHDLKERAKLLY